MMSRSREEAVWQRVMAVSGEAPACQMQPRTQQAAGGLTQDHLMDLMHDELSDSCTYRALAGRSRGNVRRCLLQLAQEEQQHYRKLETIYFVMIGRRPCVDRPKVPCPTCLSEELRKRYEEELAGAARYDKLAQNAGSFASVLHCLHHAEERHAQVILELLQQCL